MRLAMVIIIQESFNALVKNLNEFHSVETSVLIETRKYGLIAHAELHKVSNCVPHPLNVFGVELCV